MRTKIYYLLLILAMCMLVFSPVVSNSTVGVLVAPGGFFTFLVALAVSPY